MPPQSGMVCGSTPAASTIFMKTGAGIDLPSPSALTQLWNMKRATFVVWLLTVLALWAGCASPQRATSAREQEFRTQLAESIPLKTYGYAIKDLRFSPDNKKALVVFTHPDHQEGLDTAHRRPDWEFILTADEFGRYRGMNGQPFYTPGTASTPVVSVIVTLPSR